MYKAKLWRRNTEPASDTTLRTHKASDWPESQQAQEVGCSCETLLQQAYKQPLCTKGVVTLFVFDPSVLPQLLPTFMLRKPALRTPRVSGTGGATASTTRGTATGTLVSATLISSVERQY